MPGVLTTNTSGLRNLIFRYFNRGFLFAYFSHAPRQVCGSALRHCRRQLLPVATRTCPAGRRRIPGCDRSSRRYSRAFCQAWELSSLSPCVRQPWHSRDLQSASTNILIQMLPWWTRRLYCVEWTQYSIRLKRCGPLYAIGLPLGPPESWTQTTSRSLPNFQQGSLDDRPTDGPRYLVVHNSWHLPT